MAWGAVSDWVSGVATVIAVAVALVFSVRAERQKDEMRMAAVYAWFIVGPGDSPMPGQLWLHNATDLPIYRWIVRVTWMDAAGDDISVTTGSDALGLLPPGRFSFALEGGAPLPVNDALVKVDLHFTDSRQRELRRTPSGKLIREGGLLKRRREQ